MLLVYGYLSDEVSQFLDEEGKWEWKLFIMSIINLERSISLKKK